MFPNFRMDMMSGGKPAGAFTPLRCLRPSKLAKRQLEKNLGCRQQAKLMSTNFTRKPGAGFRVQHFWQQLIHGALVTPLVRLRLRNLGCSSIPIARSIIIQNKYLYGA